MKVKIILCGIGDKEAGDDFFGPYIISQIKETSNLKKINCGNIPENYLNKIIDQEPDLVVFFDTLRIDNDNAVTIIVDEELLNLNPGSTSTHNLPFSAVCMLIKSLCRANVWLVGIKALSYTELTDRTKQAAARIAGYLNALDGKGEIDIMKIYENLSHILR